MKEKRAGECEEEEEENEKEEVEEVEGGSTITVKEIRDGEDEGEGQEAGW